MEVGRADGEALGIATHLVAGHEGEPRIGGAVLFALGRHRAGELLEAKRQFALGRAVEAEGEHRLQEIEQVGVELRIGVAGARHGEVDEGDVARGHDGRTLGVGGAT